MIPFRVDSSRSKVSSQSQGNTSILIVDDNEAKAYALGRVLEKAGFPVQTVHSGRAALEAASTKHFKTVLLDVHLPDISGFEVCATLRASNHIPQPTIIFHSATDPTEAAIEQSRSVGANAFLAHPIDGEVLVTILLHFAKPGTDPASNLLGSWKEIANYFGKGVRTVQRWERQRGMPIYRPNDGSTIVFADPDELRKWAKRSAPESDGAGELD